MASRTALQQRHCSLIAIFLCICSAANAARTPKPQLRICAIGDSITEGAVPTKGYDHPYTIEMQDQLEQDLKGTRIIVDNEGVGGAGIFAVGFHKATTVPPVAQAAIQGAASRGKPFDYVVVMVGINDLLREGKSANDVKGGLQQIYDEALGTGATVIAIPPFPAPGFVSQDDYKEGQRKQLASDIKAMADAENAKKNSPNSPQVIVMDLEADRFNFYNMDASERTRWLDDGLHLTETGYNVLGRQIARVIAKDYEKRR